jgi:hypothetical protein
MKKEFATDFPFSIMRIGSRLPFLMPIFACLVFFAAATAHSADQTFYDKDGEAVVYLHNGTFYLWTGEPVAYLHEDQHIYGFNGKHLGWYRSGALYDKAGLLFAVNNNLKCPHFTGLRCPVFNAI